MYICLFFLFFLFSLSLYLTNNLNNPDSPDIYIRSHDNPCSRDIHSYDNPDNPDNAMMCSGA